MRDASRTKALISRTALRLFVKKGVTETTIRDIAKAGEIAEGTLYRHYPSKEALAWDLFATHFTAFALELDRLQQGQATLKAKLEAMIRHFCRFFDQDRTLFSYLLLVQHGQLAKVTGDMPNPVEVFRKVIAGGMARKEIPKGDPDVATAMVIGLVLQVALAHVYGRIKRDLSSLADSLVGAAWRVLKG
jgi:AcrR family transcriptional regulator